MKIVTEILYEDLPESFRELAELIGMDAVLRISAQFGGEKLHIYQIASLARAARDRAIIAEYKSGSGYMELARKYSVTTTRIRQIISKSDAKRIDNGNQKQLTLF